MDNLVATAAKLQRFLEENKVPFCYVGGIAVQHWGEPRLTRDVDLTVLAPGSEESLTELIVQNWESRIVEAAEFAIESRVLLLESDGIGIDLMLGALGFEKDMIARSCQAEFGVGTSLRICSAEDLIVMKAFSGRDLDWHDIEGIIQRQTTEALDCNQIVVELAPLLAIVDRMDALDRLKLMLGMAH